MTDEQSGEPVGRIEACLLGGREGQLILLPPADISYIFLGSAIPTELRELCREKGWEIDPKRVYVRTPRGVYSTLYRRLSEFGRALVEGGCRVFAAIGRKRMVNVQKITVLSTGSKVPSLLFTASDGRTEMLTVSRRSWQVLRRRLNLPRRRVAKTHDRASSATARDGSPTAQRRSDRKPLENSAR
jgi:hypothetical protein